jgi:YidC/Oxa1 family membrane protein insertase
MWEAVVNVLTNMLIWIYNLVGNNFGLAIILFTLLIKIATYPLQAKQIKSSTALQEMQQSKKWQDIQTKYKGEKEKLAQEQMKLYQEAGISPFSSCLPTVIQMPIMFALYQSIVRAVAATPLQLIHLTRGVYNILGSEALIPLNSKFLWMNLGQPERLNVFGLAIPVLTILVIITSYIQSKVTMPPTTNPNDQSAAMGKTMAVYMPLMMGWITYGLASGLAVYFIISNVLAVGQQALMGRVYWDNLLPKKSGATSLVKSGGKK